MRVIIAPDSFKESLSAAEVAEAIAKGVIAACPAASVDLCPMADGGEGTVDAMVAATGGRLVTADVFDPLGAPVRARFGLLGAPPAARLPGEVGLSGAVVEGQTAAAAPSSTTAIIEMAAASGLSLVPPNLRDPMRTTTFGTGGLILAALDAGATSIIIGIGGSATVDGGCGCAQAMGVSFVNADGELAICGLAGGGLADIARIDLSGRDERIASCEIRVACDVTNPLLGPDGAAAVYGPQKGATPETVELLEAGLANLARVIRDDLGIDVTAIAGGGAAGGLGAGLVAFAGATLQAGLPMVAEAVSLPRRLAEADLCITGEGQLDSQSSAGKTTVGVAQIAAAKGVPVICIPGQAAGDAPRNIFADVRPLVADEITRRLAMQQPADLLRRRAKEALQSFRPTTEPEANHGSL